MEKQLVKKSYDIQSLILCSIIALLIIIPLALLTVSFENIGMLIVLIVFIVLSIQLFAIYRFC